MSKLVHVAMVQRSGAGTPGSNLKEMSVLVEKAVQVSPKPDVVVFPEYCYFAPTNLEESQKHAETIPGPFTDAVSELARKHKVNIIPGTFVEKAEGGKVFNSCVFVDRKGEITATYRKIHLMDAIGFKESGYVEPGSELCVFDTDMGRVGMMVCYDLRFPELARSMVMKGADIVFVPSDFPAGTPLPPRTDHWDILIQSTALLNLTYVVAVNQYGQINNENPFGRSSVIDPWGTIVAAAGGREDIVHATLDMEYQERIRKRVASWENRRPDVYDLK